MAVKSTKLGPGTAIFTIAGDTPSDWSCQLSKARVVPDKDKDDDVIMLCGDTKPGATTYTAAFEGTIDQDLEDAAGIVWWTWIHKGEVAAFVFVPNDASTNSVNGDVVIDPVIIGGDEGGKDMTSDFSFDYVGFPELVPATP